jgi:hypothetical protein
MTITIRMTNTFTPKGWGVQELPVKVQIKIDFRLRTH